MKTNLLCRKKPNKTYRAMLVFAAIGGACALVALHLKKQRHILCLERSQQNKTISQTAPKPFSDGCQNVGQNKPMNEKSEINANSSEWERNLS